MPKKIVFQDEKMQNIFDNLLNQIDRIKRHNNEKGVSTHGLSASGAASYAEESDQFSNIMCRIIRIFVL